MNKFASYFIVSLASFCLMLMELLAGRMIAPFVGASIFTWTSIIGVFLLGVALGNWTGGKLADRNPTQKIFGNIFILAGTATALILIMVPVWKFIATSTFSIPFLITAFSLITFFPLAFCLSLVTPLVVKFELDKLAAAGRTVGNYYGASAAASILGTFLTGFWLIPGFGVKQLVWGALIVLLAVGSYFRFRFSKYASTLFLATAIILAGSFIKFGEARCDRESPYYCLQISEISVPGTSEVGLALVLDKLQHSHIFSPDFDPFGDGYIRIFANLISYRFPQTDKFKVLAIGGGGYVLPRYVINNYPNATVTVLEIDPAVTEINFQRLGLKPDPRLKIIPGDARLSLNGMGQEKFDLIFADAFSDLLVPIHLTTKEFIQALKAKLSANGLYAMNLVDIPAKGRLLYSNLLTVGSVFSQVYLSPPLNPEWTKLQTRRTLVIFGADEPINKTRWDATRPLNDTLYAKARQPKMPLLSAASPESKSFALKSGGIMLTDNYAPVENLLAQVYSLPR